MMGAVPKHILDFSIFTFCFVMNILLHLLIHTAYKVFLLQCGQIPLRGSSKHRVVSPCVSVEPQQKQRLGCESNPYKLCTII